MVACRDFEGQGIGGTGWRPFRGRRQRWNRFREMWQFTDASCGSSPHRGVESRRRIHTDGCGSKDTSPSMEAWRQAAIGAAIDAYQRALQIGDPNEQACRAALHAYLEYGPDDTNASDEVIKAIASTNMGKAPYGRCPQSDTRRECKAPQSRHSPIHAAPSLFGLAGCRQRNDR